MPSGFPCVQENNVEIHLQSCIEDIVEQRNLYIERDIVEQMMCRENNMKRDAGAWNNLHK